MLKNFVSFLLTLCVAVNLVEIGSAAKILSISFVSSKSHFIVYKPLLHALADRGHEVTIASPIGPDKERKNVKHYQLYNPDDHASTTLPNMFELKEQTSSSIYTYIANPFWQFMPMFEAGCKKGYESPILEQIKKEKYDLIIFTPLFNDCLYGLIHELNTTTVLLSQVAIVPWVAESFGAPTLPSFTPLLFYGFTDEMDFWERVINFLGIVYYQATLKLYYNPVAEKIYRHYVNPNAPSVKEIEKNASLILVNSHINFIPPRPLMADIIEVGGMHMQPPKTLPKDLKDFCDGAEDGFIFFSMGSFLQGSTMPEKYRQIFIRTFARLKQRVLWKWETETMADLPPNVKLSKWLPQQDVLGHKNIRLFITHGGHGGTTEALYNGVPLVGIPMFGDQLWNMKQASKKGFAIPLAFADLSEETLYDAVNRVLTEPRFREKAKFLSQLYHDSQDKPLDRAIYWVEYALRYGGARHLRSAGRDLNFFQYFSLDVMIFLSTLLLMVLAINILIVRAIWRGLFGKKVSVTSSTNKVSKKKKL